MRTIEEINAEIAELRAELEGDVTESRLAEIETRQGELADELKIAQEKQERAAQAATVRSRLIPGNVNANAEEQTRAQTFKRNRGGARNTRALLLSGGKIAQPTQVSGVNGLWEPQVSCLLDLIKVTDCTGMGVYRVAYQTEGISASATTEGSEFATGDATFAYLDITPAQKGLITYISNEINDQTPIDYEDKVMDSVRVALRKAANADVVAKVLASKLNTALTVSKITASTLDEIILSYGGDEGVAGGAVLLLNKANLKAFAAVKGTNEFLPAYRIVPDVNNVNTGVINVSGGLSCRYVLDRNLANNKMVYGVPKCAELCLFGDTEVAVSEDAAFTKNLLTIRGKVKYGTDVTTFHGFEVVTIGSGT